MWLGSPENSRALAKRLGVATANALSAECVVIAKRPNWLPRGQRRRTMEQPLCRRCFSSTHAAYDISAFRCRCLTNVSGALLLLPSRSSLSPTRPFRPECLFVFFAYQRSRGGSPMSLRVNLVRAVANGRRAPAAAESSCVMNRCFGAPRRLLLRILLTDVPLLPDA